MALVQVEWTNSLREDVTIRDLMPKLRHGPLGGGSRLTLRSLGQPVGGQSPHPACEPAPHRAPGGAALRAPALIARGTQLGAELAPATVTGVREPATVLVEPGLHQSPCAPLSGASVSGGYAAKDGGIALFAVGVLQHHPKAVLGDSESRGDRALGYAQ